ncbi:MAG: PHP domain-containing protein [Candidatus Fournierella pullistercoris]|uniref:PHP domain-containing protein n=1 Tax=Candidatus Allofournierella pullistercoris TaxID=2838597 RepID=A0A948T325_9FIRM|nr:PHP domain-containing protein [Candidatus Fournierella pullistercoris]
MLGDLHTHSTLSDGSLRVEMLPVLAARTGLDYLAVSDHDSIQSVAFGWNNPRRESVQLIPATELTAFDYKRNRRVHLLCYWPDLNSPELHEHCKLMADRRNKACWQSAQELEALYPQFRKEDLRPYCADSGVLYKSAMMQLLVQYGLADGIYQQTAKELFGSKTGKVLHDPEYQTVDQVLDVIEKARGVVVFAHPSVYNSMELVAELAAQGRLDGVEIEHPRNTPEDKKVLYQLAKEYDLIVTGGSDFHGQNTGKPRALGCCVTAGVEIQRLNALAQRRKG